MNGDEKCEECTYYLDRECRRFPPRPGGVLGAGTSSEYAREGRFPKVDKTWWCGEYKPSWSAKLAAENRRQRAIEIMRADREQDT